MVNYWSFHSNSWLIVHKIMGIMDVKGGLWIMRLIISKIKELPQMINTPIKELLANVFMISLRKM
jgi:hypothetical protein